MSINNSYFSRNNTIISRSFTNTGRNPVTELFYGSLSFSEYPNAYLSAFQNPQICLGKDSQLF